MTNKKDKTVDLFFNMMGFQYKPLEKRFLADCETAKQLAVAKKYNEGSTALKIAMLDKYANWLGL
jgi:hypothetical protein